MHSIAGKINNSIFSILRFHFLFCFNSRPEVLRMAQLFQLPMKPGVFQCLAKVSQAKDKKKVILSDDIKHPSSESGKNDRREN
jgi:hypothetical protein